MEKILAGKGLGIELDELIQDMAPDLSLIHI